MLQGANSAASEANQASHLSALLFFQLLALKIETHLRKYFQLPCEFVIDQLKSTISAIVVIPQLGQFSLTNCLCLESTISLLAAKFHFLKNKTIVGARLAELMNCFSNEG